MPLYFCFKFTDSSEPVTKSSVTLWTVHQIFFMGRSAARNHGTGTTTAVYQQRVKKNARVSALHSGELEIHRDTDHT